VFRQLVVRGFLSVDVENFGALKLNETSRPILTGKENLQLRQDVAESISNNGNKGSAKKAKISVDPIDMPLWLKLKACRKQLADEHNVPAFVVFSDATLLEMLSQHPTNKQQMLAISGIGLTKFDRFGMEFLQVLDNA